MDLSLVIQKVEPPGRIHFHSRRVKRAGRVASCSVTSLVSVSKSQRWQIVLAVIAGLLAGTVAQHKGSSVAPHQTPPGSRENSSASMVFQHSTEAWHVVEKDLQNRSTEGQPDLLGLGRNLYTRNSVADLIGTTVPFHIASTSSDPSMASGPLSSPVVQMEKNSSGGLDLAASSSGGSLSQTHASLGASSKGLEESSGTTSVVQPVEKRKPALTYTTGLFRTLSPTSPFLPSNGSASDVKPVLQTALSHPSRDTSQISASSIVQPTASTFLTSTMLPAPEGSTHGEQHIAGTSQPVTQISRRTHLNQKSTSHRGDLLPPAATGFLGYQTVAEASASPKIIGMNLSHPTLPMGTIPSEATPIATDVFHSSHGATTQRLLESILRVSTGMQPGSLPTLSPAASPKDMALLQEAVSNGQGLGSTESVIRGPLVSTAVPTTPSQSSSWPLSSSSRGVTHATLPAFVTQVDSSETKGLATHNLSWPRSVPASLGSPKSEDVTALSTTTDGIQVSAKDNAEVPLSATSVTEESGARYEVSVGRVLSGHDLATVSALTGQQTLSYSSITQASPGSEATSRFPLRNASLLVPLAPGPNSTSSTGEAESTASKLESGTTTRSPRSSPSGLSSVHLPLSTVPLELDTVPAAVSPTEGVPFAPHSATPGEGSTNLSSTSGVNLAAFLDTTEVQERTPATSPFPGEGAKHEWKEDISSTAELSTGVPGRVSILDGQSEPTVLDVSSTALPTHALSHPTITVTHSRGEETRYSVPFLHSWASLSTSEAVPSADVTSSGSYEEQMRPELQDGTRQFTTAVKISTSPSELTLSALGAASSTDSSSNLTSGTLELQPTQKHVSFPRKTTRSTSAPPLSSTFPTTDSSSSLPSAMLELQPTQKHFSFPRKTTRSTSAPPLSSTFPTTDSSSSLTSVMLELQPTQKHFSSPRKITRSMSAPPLSSTFPTTDSSSSLPSAMLGFQPTQKHVSFPRKTTRSTSAPPPSSLFLATSRMNTSMESSEPNTLTESSSTEGGSNASLPTSTTESKATLSYPFLDITGVGQPFRTTAAETRHVEMVTGRPSTGKELFSWTPSEWRLDISTLPHVGANRTEATDTSRAADTSTVFLVHSTSHGGSSKGPADLSLGETKSTVMPHPTATQAVSLTSNITALLDSSRVLPTASVLTTRVTCSGIHCLSITLPVSSAATQLPITSQTLPQKVSVTTLGSTVGKKGTTAGPSTKVDAPKMIQTTALTSTKPVTTTRGGPTSKQLVSTRRASTVGQTAERDNFTVSKQTLDVSILSLQFQLARIEYTESLASKSSVRYKKLEREVTLTLNKMLSSYESFLQANVLRFLSGSVLVQGEAMFQEGRVPTPSDMIRTIVTAIEKREMDTFFDWRMDLKSVRSNEFSLKNLEPEVLSISFTVLGRGTIATFGGLTEWGPLERLRNEVVLSLSVRYRVQNFSLAQVRNVQGDLDINGEMYVNTEAHVDIGWALEALKGLANYSVDLGSICINGSKLSLQIFQFSFLVTNRIFSEKLLDRSSMAHQRLSWDLSKALTHMLGQYQNLLQVTIREMRSGSLICQGDVIFQPPAPTNKDVVHTLALSVGPKNYLGASNIQVDPFSFMVAGAKLEPPYTNPSIPSYGIVLIFLGCLALVVMPFCVLMYNKLRWRGKIVLCRAHDPEVMVETFELDNAGFRSLTEDNSTQSHSPTEALG